MPVEIRELQITTTVQEGGGTSSSSSSPAPAAGNEDIIAKCVEQVLEILKEKTER
jgi:hypothetical protein